MARRTFTVIDVVEILRHWYAGRSKVEVAQSLGVDPKTVRRYVAPAEEAWRGAGRSAGVGGGVAGAGAGVVPAVGGHSVAAAVVVADRAAS